LPTPRSAAAATEQAAVSRQVNPDPLEEQLNRGNPARLVSNGTSDARPSTHDHEAEVLEDVPPEHTPRPRKQQARTFGALAAAPLHPLADLARDPAANQLLLHPATQAKIADPTDHVLHFPRAVAVCTVEARPAQPALRVVGKSSPTKTNHQKATLAAGVASAAPFAAQALSRRAREPPEHGQSWGPERPAIAPAQVLRSVKVFRAADRHWLLPAATQLPAAAELREEDFALAAGVNQLAADHSLVQD
jgi:hypothetical protein